MRWPWTRSRTTDRECEREHAEALRRTEEIEARVARLEELVRGEREPAQARGR